MVTLLAMLCSKRWLQLLPLLLSCLLLPTAAVKRENWKTCEQSGFCKRNRAFADNAAALGTSWVSPYTLVPDSLKIQAGSARGLIRKSIGEGQDSVELTLTINFQESGVARVIVDESKRIKGDIELRHGSKARKERYNEVSKWALVGEPTLDKTVTAETNQGQTIFRYGPDIAYSAIVHHQPFSIDFYRNNELQIQFNGHGLMNVEHWRPKVEKESNDNTETKEGEESKATEPAVKAGEDESTWWEESFGGNTDSKPKGPESVGLDITFPGFEHVYGIPGHASALSLKETRGASGGYDQPFRLYNGDVFEYEMDSPMTLYGAIPFMQAHRKDSTVGVFWMNAAETWIDVVKRKISTNPLSLGLGGSIDTETHWFSESGLLDVFVFLGPTPKDVIKQYSDLTGHTQLPQQFSIAYHQCRWNYVTDQDVKDVDKKMDRHRIPYDIIWLDIEYTDGKKYFTWDEHTFPQPLDMEKQLDANDRKLVVIIDPHIKNEGNYPVVDQLKSQNHGVKDKNGNLYEGWCWPGSSHWVDCFSPAARKWWTSLFSYTSFKGTSPNTFVWNDMNEPSVFNGPETTMPKDNMHYDNWEHRDVHNVNGLTFHNATYHALLARDNPAKRPFVLTRSFYAGSQRLGAMWTGDNQAAWSHLQASIPMILSMNIAAFPFAGADVGGFFGNPSKELLTRWYQAGAFYPFFRGHAHIDTRRREPYIPGPPYTGIITQALRLRYQLLPAWYTAFHTASTTGAPIVRPHYYVHPSDPAGFSIEDQFFLGDTGLLVKPVTTEGASSVDIYLPPGQKYFDYFTYTRYSSGSNPKGSTLTLAAPLDKIPVLMQAGHIFPRRDRPRRSSGLMKYDPYTLVIVLDDTGAAKGSLYVDDGESFDYQAGAFLHRGFYMQCGMLESTDLRSPAQKTSAAASSKAAKEFLKGGLANCKVEKIIVVNAPKWWEHAQTVTVQVEGEQAERQVDLRWHDGAKEGRADWAVVRDPSVNVSKNWRIIFQGSGQCVRHM